MPAKHISLTRHGDTDRDVSWCQVQDTNALPTSETRADQVQMCQFPVTATKVS